MVHIRQENDKIYGELYRDQILTRFLFIYAENLPVNRFMYKYIYICKKKMLLKFVLILFLNEWKYYTQNIEYNQRQNVYIYTIFCWKQ